jgi:hypothetical protein
VREWRLNKFNVITRASSRPAPGAFNARQPRERRTMMNFKLDITDAGELLKAFVKV